MNTPRSMTGYGSGTFEHEDVSYILELRSVNNRYLKVNFKFPASISQAQEHLRKLITKNVRRGTVDIFLRNSETSGESYSLNLVQAKKYLNQLKEFFPDNEFSAKDILPLQGISTRAEAAFSEDFFAQMTIGFEKALSAFNSSRISEGEALIGDIKRRLQQCEGIIEKVSTLAPMVPMEYQKKLQDRIATLLRNNTETTLDQSSLAREVAYFAEKSDITEEVVRFRHHISRFRTVLSKGGALGKECDFIVQELNREANTIGSKCSSLEISGHVISIKTEVEKIREQVQNLE